MLSQLNIRQMILEFQASQSYLMTKFTWKENFLKFAVDCYLQNCENNPKSPKMPHLSHPHPTMGSLIKTVAAASRPYLLSFLPVAANLQSPFKINQLGVGIDFLNILQINIRLLAEFHNPPISPPKSPPSTQSSKVARQRSPPPLSTNLVKDQDTLPVNRYLIHRQTFPMFKNLCKIYEILCNIESF